MAPLTMIGLLASFTVYLGTFGGLTSDRLGVGMFALHAGAILSLFPLLFMEGVGMKRRGFTSALNRALPKWVRFVNYAITGVALLTAIWFFHFGGSQGSPQIVSGQYVLDNHGVLTPVTQAEYLRVGSLELRFFAAIWLVFYFYDVSYWWFLKQPISSNQVGEV